MPQSMTGFSRVETQTEWGTLSCELRSVNHRFLDLHFRLPEQLRELEFDIRQQLKRQLNRGKIDCSIYLQINKTQQQLTNIDRQACQLYIDAAQQIASMLDTPQAINPLEILSSPGVLPPSEIDSDELQAITKATLNSAINKMIEIRAREGEELKSMVQQRIDGIRQQVDIVANAIPDIRQALEARLRERLESLDLAVNPERLEQELVIQGQKMDVDEEIDRLRAHLTEVEHTINSNKPIGRRLDFLMQELNREANTLGSKSQSITSTNVAVEIKVMIEQMREQIQNIE